MDSPIYLNDNKLETICFNLFQGLIKLRTILLNGNPLTTEMNVNEYWLIFIQFVDAHLIYYNSKKNFYYYIFNDIT
jgi:hypothetical protein